MIQIDWGDVLLRMRHNWRLLFAVIVPILLIPVAFGFGSNEHTHDDDLPGDVDPYKKFRAAYVITLMAFLWIFEVIPLAITSLLPLVLFPLLRVQDASVVSQNYMRESNMIFLGAIIIALSIEYCGLHIRAALKIISIFGVKPPRIMIGTICVTAALSMWISDTSCVTMILPMLSAITHAMFQEEQLDAQFDEYVPTEDPLTEVDPDMPQPPPRNRRVSVVFPNFTMERGGTGRRKSKRSTNDLGGPIARRMSQAPPTNPISSSPTPSSPTQGNNKSIRELKAKAKEDSSTEHSPKSSKLTLHSIKIALGMDPEPNAVHPESNQEESGNVIDEEKVQHNIRKMLLFGVAYAANIGGTGTLVGTGPIKVFKELNKIFVHKTDPTAQISFATWMAYTNPIIIINIALLWVFLIFKYYGLRNVFKKTSEYNTKRERVKVREYLEEETKKLGPITSHEIGVMVIFCLVVFLWITRDPQLFSGWDELISPPSYDRKGIYKATKTGDSTPAMFAACLLFILPQKWNFLDFRTPYKAPAKYEALLDWKFVASNAPWGYVLLIGSGYAIADACNHSGLSCHFANELKGMANVGPSVLLFVTVILTSVITEVVSNTASATLILPVLFSVSCSLKIHPTYLTMASAISGSYAFMLPISSPPNAIVFATGDIPIKEMIMNGIFLNLVCVLVLYVTYITYGEFIFQFSAYTGDCKNTTLCGIETTHQDF